MPLARFSILTFVATLALCGTGCSAGTASTNDGNGFGNEPAQPAQASCSITSTGPVAVTHTCMAIVAYYQGKMAVVVNDRADEDASFVFALEITDEKRLTPGTYDATNTNNLAATLTLDGQDGGPSTTWVTAAQKGGSSTTGTLKLQIASVGAEKNETYGGTKGTIDATLVDASGAQGAVTAHVDFVSTGY